MQTLVLTGDVNLRNVSDPGVPFALVADMFKEADVVFGNLEGCLYDASVEVPYKRGWFHAGTEGASALQRGGFHAVGCANNVTFGEEAIVSTLARLDEMGIAHCGAGTSRADARAPVVLERDGTSYGFLQYTSVFWPIGHEAEENSTGVAALKAHTAYQPNVRIPEMPGGPPTVVTWPDADYPKEFEDDVSALRSRVDVLVVSCHWGISGSDETADYQVDMAHAAIDAGADLVMGHGPHVIQGAEVYKGKAAFYSLDNFHFGSEAVEQDWVGMMLRAKVDDGRIVEVSCHPVRPNAERQTVVRSVEDEREVMRIFEEHSRRFGATAGFSDGAIVG